MKPPRNFRKALRSRLLGHPGYSTALDLPLHSPQTEVAVWLHGMGEPRDVTHCHSVACPMPAFFCISFEKGVPEQSLDSPGVSLHFVERAGQRQVLGKIDLQYHSTVATSGPELRLYRATDCISTCLPRHRRWIRSLYFAHERWQARRSGRPQILSLDNRCNEVVFLCPRPVVLVSLFQAGAGNIFPLNLMGRVGEHHFVFALNASKKAGAAVSNHSQFAISTVPFEQAQVVRDMGAHHHQTSIDFAHLPFSLHPSPSLGIPVPDFALTVRELQIESALPLGSHNFFIARILGTQTQTSAPEFHRIHGIYAARRERLSKAYRDSQRAGADGQ
ncbi:flavin reductase [Granulicella sibirica]|uniref:Flavin reductase like domain-containing protein n=1 Tax=Granulicella sibirica TaxID=2479048 RepID=A0A4Q0SV15_9BACT|nr:flavin reductase [Granulicella sibirica]RXH54182.1 hypothetical protein GRAN_4833 [Granulicella sibirica]